MRVDGGGSGIVVPRGDPAELFLAAGRLRQAALEVEGAHRTLTSGVHGALASWTGQAADAYRHVSGSVGRGYAVLSEAQTLAARAIDEFARQLEHAQDQARRAIADVDRAEQDLSGRLRVSAAAEQAAAASTAADAAVQLTRAQDQAGAARDEFAAAHARAVRAAQVSAEDLAHAEASTARALEELAGHLREMTRHELVDVLGAPTTALTLQMAGLVTASTGKALQTFQALRSADFGALERLSAEGFGEVERAAATFGEDSPQALRAWYQWQARSLPGAMQELGDAVGGFGHVPKGAVGVFDVIGKAGIPLAVFADVMTIRDSESSGLDRGLSAANLGGIGMAALGTDTATAGLGLIGLNAAADWVPVVGEVVIAGTAVYLASEWAYAHRHEIADAAKAAERGALQAQQWVAAQELSVARGGAQLASETAAGAYHAGVAAAQATTALAESGAAVAHQAAATVLTGAADLADGAEHEAGKVLSGLNPFK